MYIRIKFRTFITNLLLVIISMMSVLLSAELGVRAYLAFFPALNFQSQFEFRKSRPLPYKDSSYDVVSFTKEAHSQPGWITPPNSRLVIPLDFHGRYITIEHGIRKTTDQPAQATNVIYIFGGSTVFCSEVPDQYTVPSFIQRLVNKRFPASYKVENYGASTVVSAQELERLKTVKLKRGDVVVFFDGANDAYISIYNKDPKGWILGENNKILFEKGLFAEFQIKLHHNFGRFSKFIQFFLSPYDYRFEPTHLKDRVQVTTLANEMSTRYAHNILSAHDYSVSTGSSFFHFLQPTIFSGQNTSLYQYHLQHNPYFVAAGIEKALTEGYKGLRPVITELNNKRVSSLDISKIFDKRLPEDEYFLDWVHVSEKGNAIIANVIFTSIEHSLRQN